jgi:hypothetical protein
VAEEALDGGDGCTGLEEERGMDAAEIMDTAAWHLGSIAERVMQAEEVVAAQWSAIACREEKRLRALALEALLDELRGECGEGQDAVRGGCFGGHEVGLAIDPGESVPDSESALRDVLAMEPEHLADAESGEERKSEGIGVLRIGDRKLAMEC